MHPSPQHLNTMTTAELKAYRAELLELEAEHGAFRYRETIGLIDEIVHLREHVIVIHVPPTR